MKHSASKALNVLYLTRWYPNRYDPMPGLFIRRHALSVSEKVNVSLLYVHLAFDKNAHGTEQVYSDALGIRELVIYVRASDTGIKWLDSFLNLWRFLAANWSGIRKLRRIAGKPDLVHVNVLTRCGLVALIHRMFCGVPYVITEHWTRYLPGMDNYRGWLRKFMTRVVVRNASAVLPVTLNLQRAMELHGLRNEHYCVIPNVVDTELFHPAEKKSDKHARKILHVSCFEDKQKNISGLLRVLKRLSQLRHDWHCTMVGEGIHFEKLVRYASELGIKDTFVFFTGLRENQDLVELMQQADFQVMFSRYENLPVVIPESFACGLPFVSTNVGGIAEHIHEDSGLLLPSEDENALLDSLIFMLDHPEKFDKVQIRKYAIDHFSKEVIGNQLFTVYMNAVGR